MVDGAAMRAEVAPLGVGEGVEEVLGGRWGEGVAELDGGATGAVFRPSAAPVRERVFGGGGGLQVVEQLVEEGFGVVLGHVSGDGGEVQCASGGLRHGEAKLGHGGEAGAQELDLGRGAMDGVRGEQGLGSGVLLAAFGPELVKENALVHGVLVKHDEAEVIAGEEVFAFELGDEL